MMKTESQQPSARSIILAIVDDQPEDGSYEEILRELAFDRMVEHGLRDGRSNRVFNNHDAAQKIQLWRK
ncbi:MAG: hypothetical protein ABIP64_18130 [Burkholderiales bacterium]